MKTTLDSSHRTVLENLGTLERAQRCLDEIKSYRWEILHELADELTVKHDPKLRFQLERGGWIEAKTFPNSQGTNRHLINVGIERLEVSSIIDPNGTAACRAFIFSEVLADPKTASRHKALAQSLRELKPPVDFAAAPPQEHGYLFVKILGNVSIDAFCSRQQLKKYFERPLVVLVDWLARTTVQLTSLHGQFAASTRIRKS